MFSEPRNLLHKGSRERKYFYYLTNIKSECDAHHGQSAEIAKTERNLTLSYSQPDTTYYMFSR